MRLIGTRPPQKWPVKVFWLLLLIHLPLIALMVVTEIVRGTILSMVVFWIVTVPTFLLSLLLNPLMMASAIIAAYLIWYAMRCDWTPFLRFLFGPNTSDHMSNFVRGRRLNSDLDLRNRLASRRMTLRGSESDRDRHFGIRH